MFPEAHGILELYSRKTVHIWEQIMTAIEHDIDSVSKGKAYKAQVINIISNEINICGSEGQAINSVR